MRLEIKQYHEVEDGKWNNFIYSNKNSGYFEMGWGMAFYTFREKQRIGCF